VTYVVYPDEGHGFAKPGNRLAYVALMEVFLAHIMGGALEAMGEDLKGSSHEVRAGADVLEAMGVQPPS
jgi:acylaminoacyl-peptidase